MGISPDANEKAKWALQQRIDAVQKYLRDHCLTQLPDDVNVDDLAPGTSQYLIGFKPKGGRHHADLKALMKRKRERMKRNAGGLIGVTLSGNRYVAIFRKKHLGQFGTAIEAAMVYNAEAKKQDGDDAVLCDIDAAERFQRSVENQSSAMPRAQVRV